MSIAVSNSDKSLEASTLTSTGLLLDRHDLKHFILEGSADEEVDNFELLDRQGEEVDFLEGADFSVPN